MQFGKPNHQNLGLRAGKIGPNDATPDKMKPTPLQIHVFALVLAMLCGVSSSLSEEPLRRIAAGSCNRQDLPQPLWNAIVGFHPELWLWLGDNIYGDTDDMSVLKQKWDKQKENPGYKHLLSMCPVEGVWDDHDYGRNDAGVEYRWKQESQHLFLDFLGEPPDSPRRRQSGIYAARHFGPAGQQVCLILLDVRTFRGAPRKGEDILGEAQWAWLKQTLESSKAQVHIICSGSQILPSEHRHEKWADYPDSRDRLFKLLAATQPIGVILLSGDRHFGEISRLENPHGGSALHEMTTSGLTHSFKNFQGEPNTSRIGEAVVNLNFGTLSIDWPNRNLELAIRDAEAQAVCTVDVPF
jgi:alkaline phosphatase D